MAKNHKNSEEGDNNDLQVGIYERWGGEMYSMSERQMLLRLLYALMTTGN
jgi:hypothetical protein